MCHKKTHMVPFPSSLKMLGSKFLKCDLRLFNLIVLFH